MRHFYSMNNITAPEAITGGSVTLYLSHNESQGARNVNILSEEH